MFRREHARSRFCSFLTSVSQYYRNRLSTPPVRNFYNLHIVWATFNRYFRIAIGIFRICRKYFTEWKANWIFSNFSLVIRQLNVTADLKLGVKNERMQVSNLVIHAHVKEFDVSVVYDYSADFYANWYRYRRNYKNRTWIEICLIFRNYNKLDILYLLIHVCIIKYRINA